MTWLTEKCKITALLRGPIHVGIAGPVKFANNEIMSREYKRLFAPRNVKRQGAGDGGRGWPE